MKEATNFLAAPDFAKFFGICLVVFGHVIRGLFNAGVLPRTEFWIQVDAGIYLFHMPLFFFLSGLFLLRTLEQRTFSNLLKKNALTLLIPLVAWSYFQFSIQYLAGDAANVKKTILDVVTAPFPPKEQFWFLWTLFSISGLMSLVFYLYRRSEIFFVLFLLFSLVFVLGGELGYRDIANGYFLKNIPFFLLGIVFRNWKPHPQFFIGLLGPIILFFLVQIIFLSELQNSDPAKMVMSIICVLCVYAFCFALSISEFSNSSAAKAMLFIGMNSMIIYLAHVICEAAARVVLIKMNIFDAQIHIVLGWLSGMVAPLLLALFLLRFSLTTHPLVGYIFPVRSAR